MRDVIPRSSIVLVLVSASHPQSAVLGDKSLVPVVTSQKIIFLIPDPHGVVPRSLAGHIHQFAGHTAAAPSHVAVRTLRLIFITREFTVRVHSPALLITFVFGRPCPHTFAVVELKVPIMASTYALLTASVLDVGVATFIILLFVISRDFLIVVVPFISSSVAGDNVRIPILPTLSPKSAPNVIPGVPDGGPANVHAAKASEPARISAKTLLDILISVPRRTTL
jgi:hypothetical protein